MKAGDSLYNRSNGTKFRFLENSYKIPDMALISYMEIRKRHTIYLFFHSNSKLFLISHHVISLLFTKVLKRRLNFIEFAKNQERIGIFVCFQTSYKGKIDFELCSQLIKILNSSL